MLDLVRQADHCQRMEHQFSVLGIVFDQQDSFPKAQEVSLLPMPFTPVPAIEG